MNDFTFTNVPTAVDFSNEIIQGYMTKFNLTRDEYDHIELITNLIAQDHFSIPSIIVVDNNDLYDVSLKLNDWRESMCLFADLKRYIDKGAYNDPINRTIHFSFTRKEQAQFFVTWLMDYKVQITEFAYPLADFIV